MERNQLKGMWTKAKGRVKQAFGRQTGDESLEARGNIDEAKGGLQQRFGEVKEKASRKISELFDRYRARRRPRPGGSDFQQPTP